MRDLIAIVESGEVDDDAERIFAAYRKKHHIDLNDMMRMSDAEVDQHRATALANRHLYPVPTTEPDFLYHGTAKARLPQIAADGLVPSERSRWAKDGYAGHSLGRVFFAGSIDKAEFYAREASKTRPVILRVRRVALADMQPDMKETDGNYFVERAVPAAQIEVWNGRGWAPLTKP